jgi:hypothetical protein
MHSTCRSASGSTKSWASELTFQPSTSARIVAPHRLYRRLGFRRDPALDWEPEPDLWLRGFRLRLDETMVIR